MKMNMKKLAVAAMLTAVAVALSTFSIPIGASKCFPIQHLCNVIAGVFLGPWYGMAMAFCACTGSCGRHIWARCLARGFSEGFCAIR